MRITSTISRASVKVFVNDILHVHFMRDKFLGLQAYQYEAEQMFYIDITLTSGVLTCDYDRQDMWLGVLAELGKAR